MGYALFKFNRVFFSLLFPFSGQFDIRSYFFFPSIKYSANWTIGNDVEKENEKIIKKGPKRVSPFFIPMAISNIASANVAIKYGLKGICESVITACASGASAINYAYRILQQGLSSVILSGGTEAAITPLSLAGFTSMGALCSNNLPEKASTFSSGFLSQLARS